MSSTPTQPQRSHPLHRFTGRLHEVLDDLTGTGVPSLWSLSAEELTVTLTELTTVLPRLAALQLAVLAEVDRSDLATDLGAVNAAGWLRSRTRVTGPDASRLVKQARALEAHPVTAAELAAGRVRLEQAREVIAAVEALPASVGAEDRERAERHLLVEAGQHDAQAVKALGRHLLAVIDPDAADEQLATQLERDEELAARSCHLSTWEDGQGSLCGKFKVPILPGLQLKTMLQAIANPTLPTPIARKHTTGQPKTTPEVMGEAFCQLIDRYPIDKLPHTGGSNATVVVTIPMTTLEGRLTSAQILGSTHRLSPGEARRLACQAGVIPAVLDGKSQVLDLGRKRRLHTPPQRLAMALQQHGVCAVEDCDRPALWADAHHLQEWTRDQGETNTRDGVLICPRHHTLAHSTHLTVTRLGTGKLRFHRRT